MTPVPGPDLARALEALATIGQWMPVRAAFQIASEVAEALDAAYSALDGQGNALRVVHRDIKPSNVLLTADGQVAVADFGVASMNLEAREGNTGLQVGSLRYMAPERIRREPDTPSGDVYALAATLAELLIGAPIGVSPIESGPHAAFVDDVLDRVTLRFEGSAGFARSVLGSALHADPNARPSTRDFGERCREIAEAAPDAALRSFARRFVPTVDATLGDRGKRVERILLEAPRAGTGSFGPAQPAPSTSSASVQPAPAGRAVPWLALIGAVGAAGAAAVAGMGIAAGVWFSGIVPGLSFGAVDGSDLGDVSNASHAADLSGASHVPGPPRAPGGPRSSGPSQAPLPSQPPLPSPAVGVSRTVGASDAAEASTSASASQATGVSPTSGASPTPNTSHPPATAPQPPTPPQPPSTPDPTHSPTTPSPSLPPSTLPEPASPHGPPDRPSTVSSPTPASPWAHEQPARPRAPSPIEPRAWPFQPPPPRPSREPGWDRPREGR